MNDGQALYDAVCKYPNDNTPRLVYADYLDEQGSTEIECIKCKGKGSIYDSGELYHDHWYKCKECDGNGTTINNDNAIRAEYIRLSISSEYPPADASFVAIANWQNDKKRAEKILQENYDRWTYLKCELCKQGSKCRCCGNTGNAYRIVNRRHGIHDEVIEDITMRAVTYHRGFPVGITCRMDEIFAFSSPMDKRVGMIEWAKSIVRCTPITMFKPLNYRPNMQLSSRHRDNRTWVWADGVVNQIIHQHSLPIWLFNMVWELSINYANTVRRESTIDWELRRFVDCESSAQAYEILSTVIGNVVRSEVYGDAH